MDVYAFLWDKALTEKHLAAQSPYTASFFNRSLCAPAGASENWKNCDQVQLVPDLPGRT